LDTLNFDGLSFDDVTTGLKVRCSTPTASPLLWRDYLDAAHQRYALHGVESALPSVTGESRSNEIFWSIFDSTRTIAGLRVLVVSDSTKALTQEILKAHPHSERLKLLIRRRCSEGILEGATAFVSESHRKFAGISDILARCIVHSLILLQARYLIGSAAEHSLPLWKRTGATVMDDIGAFPYPDDRYRSVVIWWDVQTFASLCNSEQLKHVFLESGLLLKQLESASGTLMRVGR
jgi:hypothetical protein